MVLSANLLMRTAMSRKVPVQTVAFPTPTSCVHLVHDECHDTITRCGIAANHLLAREKGDLPKGIR